MPIAAFDGFGSTVVGACCGEVAEECVFPLVEGPAQAGDLGDRAGREGSEDFLGDLFTVGVSGLVVERAQLLGAVPGDLDLDVSFIGSECRLKAGLLSIGEVFLASAEHVTDAI